ncbi:autotransporter domain-containing protein [Reyranella sp.]|uniref:autotransporter domain-containing protein n=1 Tax=Reyranella sp. TaxID=1929291 RepID=UPI003BACA33F
MLATTSLSGVWRSAEAADFIVSNNGDSGAGSLRQAIINSNAAGGANTIVINSGVGTITLTSGDLPSIANNATIVGNNNTLSGGGAFRGLFVGAFSGTTQTAVTVSISDLAISNTQARGGNGATGGGGGAGLGGALFVAAQANVTVSNVTLSGNAAVGGNGNAGGASGGGGGMGGNGTGGGGGGGGLGSGANGGGIVPVGQPGIATGGSAAGNGPSTSGGATGGGGGGGSPGPPGQGSGAGGGVGGGNGVAGAGTGGTGGFGGGGGGGISGAGGVGGFGGGGGGGVVGGAGGFGGGGGASNAAAGAGGFGGGNGSANPFVGSGGGLGAGGAIFVQQGGTLTLAGPLNVSGGTVTGGTGAGAAGSGSALGSGIFLQGDGTLTFAPAAGQSQTVADVIADQTGSGGTGVNAGSWALVKNGAGTLALSAANTYSGGTAVTGGLVNFAAAGNFGSGTITLNGGGLQWATGNTTDISSRLAALGSGGATFDTNGNNVSFATGLGGGGGLTKAGAGTLTLTAANSYSGGTTVSGGTLQLANANALPTGGALSMSGGTLALGGSNVSVGALSGSGGTISLGAASLTTDSATSTTFGGSITGTGGLTKLGTGTLSLTGASTYSGATTVSAGTLAVNGSIASSVTVGAGGTLGGTGTIGGNVASTGAIAPGNSIGTLTVTGNFSQTGGTYVVEANAQGQSDRVNVGGSATIGGTAVQVVAASGSYAANTTYTILNAAGGVNGRYTGVSSNFAFLTPSLAYDPNNVFLTLALQGNAFSVAALTPNQRAVGAALDQSYAGATGDFATVTSALSVLSTQQGPGALNQISGQPYADFGTFNVASNALFMNAVGQQMAVTRGGAVSGGQRQALAEACDLAAACDGVSPFGAWASALGGVGSVQGDGNASTFTYTAAGAAAGVDYRVAPNVLVGLATGFISGTQWVDGFSGKGWSNGVSVAGYGSFALGPFYVDALAGYAYANNQLQRQIAIPGLQPRTASGSTGANQFLGQAEAGYRLDAYAPAQASVTPFARFQASSVNQAAFNEWGANSLSLAVAQQTTTSLRSTLGADLAGAIGIGDTRTLELGLRLGWLHEYANTARPVAAAFAGAPSAAFTVYGATPQRDFAVIGFRAGAAVAAATRLYLRYDGEIGSGADNHAINLGLRLSW